jgi:hypothetical protein
MIVKRKRSHEMFENMRKEEMNCGLKPTRGEWSGEFTPISGSNLLHANHLHLLVSVCLMQLLHLLLQPLAVVLPALLIQLQQHDCRLRLLQPQRRILQLLFAGLELFLGELKQTHAAAFPALDHTNLAAWF